jgi:2-polyprenyl-6-methoxyphenol hydroxylase-like FAD-dependent oxidoreductase
MQLTPMLPFQGQGGAMAIEDAMILARALASSDTPDQAFAAYQATRFERVGQAPQSVTVYRAALRFLTGTFQYAWNAHRHRTRLSPGTP